MKRHSSAWDFAVRALRQLFSRRRFAGEGFEVIPVGNWKLLYREGDRVLEIFTETLHGSDRWWDIWVGVHLDGPLMWKPPFAGEAISPSRLAAIAANIEQALDALDEPYEIIRNS